jgi:hypothetical protein
VRVRRTWIAGLVLAAVGASAPVEVSTVDASAMDASAVDASASFDSPGAGPGPSGPAPVPGPAYRSVRTYAEVAAPVRLRIPAERIDTDLLRLGLERDGSISAPASWQRAGWYEDGPRPGQPGPAVLVGHVDAPSGPAVFTRLSRLRTGEAVYVDRADGSTARFVVTGQARIPKDRFPAARVYAPTLQVSLILMTCGGSFDAASGHYRDNVLVTAVPG